MIVSLFMMRRVRLRSALLYHGFRRFVSVQLLSSRTSRPLSLKPTIDLPLVYGNVGNISSIHPNEGFCISLANVPFVRG